jgi:zinc protease
VPPKVLETSTSTGRGKVYLIDKPDAPQSVIVAAHLVAPAGTPQDLAVETALRNYGGMATSRLNRNLRLEKHWSYGASGFITGTRGQRAFVTLAPVQTDKTKESMVEVMKEIRGLAGARPLAGEELDSILRSQVARLAGRFETLDSLVSAATDVVNLNRDPAYYYDYAKNAQALDGDALNATTAALVKPDELTWIVVGDLKKVEAGVRELAYGEIVRLGVDGKPAN